MSFLSGLLYTNQFEGTSYAFLDPILKVLDEIIWPILIIVAAVGTIYAIYLGVMMAKAENAEAREEAKKRIINAVIAIAVMVVLILLLKLFTQFAGDLLGIQKPEGSTSSLIGLLRLGR